MSISGGISREQVIQNHSPLPAATAPMPHEILQAKGYTLVNPLGKGAYGQVTEAPSE